jgi:hypothetical protein
MMMAAAYDQGWNGRAFDAAAASAPRAGRIVLAERLTKRNAAESGIQRGQQ